MTFWYWADVCRFKRYIRGSTFVFPLFFMSVKVSSSLWGIGLVVLASVLYGVMPIVTKDLYAQGMSTSLVLFFRFSLAALSCGLYARYRRLRLWLGWGPALFEMLAVALVGGLLTGLLLFFSYEYTSVGLATLLHFVYPLFVVATMVFFLGERPTWRKLLAVLLSLLGMYLLVGTEGEGSGWGMLLALASGATYAFYILGVNHSRVRALSPLVVTFYVTVAGGLVMGLMLLWQGQWQMPFGWRVAFDLLALSQLCTVVALVALAEGARRIGATRTALLNIIEPMVSVLLGVWLLSEPFGWRMACGCLLVLLSLAFSVKK